MTSKRILARLLLRTPLPAFMRRRLAGQLTIIMFHGFYRGPFRASDNLEHKHLEVGKWDAMLAHLARHYRVLPMGEAVDCLRRRKSLPANAVCLTLDDGFRSTHDLAFPALQRHQLPASIYLATEFVNDKRPIWVDRVTQCLAAAGSAQAEVRQIKDRLKTLPQERLEAEVERIEQASGHAMPRRVDDPGVPDTLRSLDWDQARSMLGSGLVEFGSHTHSHWIVSRCTPEVMRRELTLSRRMIADQLGVACDLFCYPNGTAADFSDVSERIVRDCGYHCSLTTRPGRNPPGSSAYGLRRLGVSDQTDLTRFALTVSGVMFLIERQPTA